MHSSVLRLFRIFLHTPGTNQWMVLLCLLASGFAQGLSLAGLVPLITFVAEDGKGFLSGDGTDEISTVNRIIVQALATLGLEANLGVLLALVVVAITLKSVLNVLAMKYVGYAVAEVAAGMRTRLIDNLLRARWSYFTSQPVGRIVNAVSLESSFCGDAYLLVAMLASSVTQCVIFVGLAFVVSWKLALVAVAIGGVVTLAFSYLVAVSRKAGRRQFNRIRELVTHLSDALIGIKPVKAMERQDDFAALFHRKIDQIRKAYRWEILSREMLNSLREPLIAIILALGFYFLTQRAGMQIAEVLVMGLLMRRTVRTIGKVQSQIQDAAVVESAYWSVHRMIEDSLEQVEPATGTRTPTLERGCRFEHVSFSFGEKRVLENVDLAIPVNQLTLLIGTSGAGKTTLTDLLLAFYQPDEGEILIDGVPLGEIDVRKWRRMIGYVPQELMLFHDTVLANITLGDASISRERAEAALRRAGAWDFVGRLPDGILSPVGERGGKLSGGQRQRIALARALVHDPRLLILDEVTSALDTGTEAELCESIADLKKSMTVLAISHRPAWLAVADSVYELESPGTDFRAGETARSASL